MVPQFEEADAVAALAPERDECVQGVLEFMAACGVHMSTVPPQLFELLTAYGFRAVGIGRALGEGKRIRPLRASSPHSGVVAAPRLDGAASSSEPEPTRRVLRPGTRRR